MPTKNVAAFLLPCKIERLPRCHFGVHSGQVFLVKRQRLRKACLIFYTPVRPACGQRRSDSSRKIAGRPGGARDLSMQACGLHWLPEMRDTCLQVWPVIGDFSPYRSAYASIQARQSSKRKHDVAMLRGGQTECCSAAQWQYRPAPWGHFVCPSTDLFLAGPELSLPCQESELR